MKSERRHKLERNVLADYLGVVIAKVKPAIPYAGAAVAILVVGALIYAIYSSSQFKSSAVAWSDFYFRLADNDPASFEDMADIYPDTEAGRWARQRAADLNLRRGMDLLYTNRQEAVERIEQAITDYEKVEQATRNPRLRAFSQFGLAKAHEALGQIEEASQYYEKVIGSDLPPAIIQYASDRLKFLSSAEGRSFYAWLKEHQPQVQPPMSLPEFDSPASDTPNLQFTPPTDAGNSSAPNSDTLDPSILPPLPAGEQSDPPAAAPGGGLPSGDSASEPSAGAEAASESADASANESEQADDSGSTSDDE